VVRCAGSCYRRRVVRGAVVSFLVVALGCSPELGPGFIAADDAVDVCAGIVEVPDEALREALLAVLPQPGGREDDDEPVISGVELRRLQGLRAPDQGITDLTGLECALSLESLGLSGNEVRDLSPVAHLVTLTQIELSDNGITDLSMLARLPRLEKLSLADNGINDISPLSELPALRFLDLSGNEVADVSPLAELEELTGLVLSRNQLTDIAPLANARRLVSLDLEQNDIQSIGPLEQLTALRYVDLDRNRISTIAPLAGADGLVELEASRNQLTSLSGIENKPDLIRIVARDNAITTTAGVEGLGRLVILDLGGNEIRHLPGVGSLQNLERLNLPNNDIEHIGAVAGLPELRDLDVRFNPRLTDISVVASLPLLGTFFGGGGGQVLDLTPLGGRPVLRRIVYVQSEAIDLGFLADLPALDALDLSGTSLEPQHVEQVAAATGLRTLDLSETGIDDISPLTTFERIDSFSARENAIDSIEVMAHWSTVRNATLSGNPLEDLSGLEALPNLADLRLVDTLVADLGRLVANEDFRGSAQVDVTGAPIDGSACPDIATLRGRGVTVVTDVDCD
jgi:Leucine-rich repeat (LRR) protein